MQTFTFKNFFQNHLVQGAFVAIALFVLVACGGGGSSSSSNSNSSQEESKPVQTGTNSAGITLYQEPKTLAGTDKNGNGIADKSEEIIPQAVKVFINDSPSLTKDAETEAKISEVITKYYKDMYTFLSLPNDQLPTTTKAGAEMFSKVSEDAFCLAQKYNLKTGDFFWSRLQNSSIYTEEQRNRLIEFQDLSNKYFDETGIFVDHICN